MAAEQPQQQEEQCQAEEQRGRFGLERAECEGHALPPQGMTFRRSEASPEVMPVELGPDMTCVTAARAAAGLTAP
ncbi:hypothetical protein GCM10010519_12310 [Streptomyces lactacystinicus]